VLVSPHGQVFEYGILFEFLATNNMSGYETLLASLGQAEALEVFPLYIHSDF
jgi:hypothetical protein